VFAIPEPTAYEKIALPTHVKVVMILEEVAGSTSSLGLLERIRRGWARDSNLSLARRILKGAQFGAQLLRGRTALKDCDRVGVNARVAGRMKVENHGSIHIGDHVNINSSWVPTELIAGHEGRIDIGDDVLINFGTVIAAGSAVTIGSGSMIGPHCIISDVDIPEAAAELAADDAKPIVIGKDVWLAGRVTVRPGVTIGNGAVVVAGSIVETDIPENAMAIGIPARLLPKLSTAPSAKRDYRGLPGSSARVLPKTSQPRLSGIVIGDFLIEDVAQELANADGGSQTLSVAVTKTNLSHDLTASPSVGPSDFAVILTTPAAIPAFATTPLGESVDEEQVMAQVEAFCARVEQLATHFRVVLVATWTTPAYLSWLGLSDSQSARVLMTLASMNLRLFRLLGRIANVGVLDAARWQAASNLSAFNSREWYLGDRKALRPLIAAATRDVRTALDRWSSPQRRLLVLDWQDAFWDVPTGAPGGFSEARLSAFTDFQQMLHVIKVSGISLALVGTTDESTLLEAIRRHPHASLTEVDFTVQGGCGTDAVETLNALATRSGVGLDSVVYITTREAVRARLRAALPMVLVPDWPQDPLLFPSALQSLRCLATRSRPGV